MPWKIEDVDSHKKGLTEKEKEQWVTVANSVYDKCLKDGGTDNTCAVDAIKQANGATEKKSIETEKEVRIISDVDSEVRILADSRHVEGHGIVVNSVSRDMGGWREVILPEAINGLIESNDVLALVNHNVDKGVLARSTNGQGSLNLSVDVKGLAYSFDAPKTNLGDELIEGIKRGDIRTSSFAFTIKDQKRDAPIEKQPDGTWLRTIKKFDSIHDVSMVYHEAYENTDVALRELRSLEEQNILEEELRLKMESEAKAKAEKPVIDPIEWYRNRLRNF
jgi:HK97 family phage prohead protease